VGRDRRLLVFAWRAGVIAFALVGWALFAWTFAAYWPGAGYDAHTYWRAAQELVAGRSPYSGAYGGLEGFRYAPPLAILFAPAAALSFDAFKVAMVAVNVVALRYAVGSWRWAGIMIVNPIVLHQLYLGNVNLPIAAALYASFRASSGPLALAGLAKLSPFLVLPQLARTGRRMRPFALWLGGAGVLTLPALWLWPAWITALFETQAPEGTLPFPFPPRLALALALLAVAWYRRVDWLAALAAAIAVPVLWASTIVILLAPARLLLEDWQARRSVPQSISGDEVRPSAGPSAGAIFRSWRFRPRTPPG
jgi:hypothetical protein